MQTWPHLRERPSPDNEFKGRKLPLQDNMPALRPRGYPVGVCKTTGGGQAPSTAR